MSRKPSQLRPSDSAAQCLGALLRWHRCRRGMSPTELARRVAISPDLLRKLELGTRRPNQQLLEDLDRELACDGQLLSVCNSLNFEKTARNPSFSAIKSWSAERFSALALRWVLNSSSIQCSVPARDPEWDTLAKLRSAGHEDLPWAYSAALELRQDIGADLAKEEPDKAISLAEFIAYSAFDAGDVISSAHHYCEGVELAMDNKMPVHGAHLLSSLAYLVNYCGWGDCGYTLIRTVLGHAPKVPFGVTDATRKLVEARSLSILGLYDDCLTVLNDLEQSIEAVLISSGECSDVVSYFGLSDYYFERAYCFFNLGQYEACAAEALKSLENLPQGRVRRNKIVSALRGVALVKSGSPDEAAAIARSLNPTQGALSGSSQVRLEYYKLIGSLLEHPDGGTVEKVIEFNPYPGLDKIADK